MLFFTLLLAILGLSSWAVFQFLLWPASQLVSAVGFVHGVIYGLALMALASMVQERRGASRVSPLFSAWASVFFFCFLGVHSLLFVAATLAWIPLLIWPIDAAHAALYMLIGAYVFMLIGVVVARMGPRVRRLLLHDAREDSVRVAQISDLHIGPLIGPRYVKQMVKRTMAQAPDCIVLTGDIGDGDPAHHAAAIRELAALSAPLGVFVSLGNHELYHDTRGWVQAFEAIGMRVLVDEAHRIVWKERPILLVGLAPYGDAKSIRELQGIWVEDETRIVLSHYPHRAQEAADAGAHLFLAGHTHGGQFWPFSWLIHLFHRHAKGYYRIGEMHAYIHLGSGYWGPPLRLGARAEVVVVEL